MRLLSAVHGPVYGGVHTQVARLAQPLRERDWDLLCLMPDEPGSGVGRLEQAGVEVVTLPLHRLRATAGPVTHWQLAKTLPREVAAIRRLLRERDIDLVQVHGPTNPHGAIAAHRDDRAVVWQLPDTRPPMSLRRLTMPMVVRLADVVTTVGDALADAYPGTRALGRRHVSFLPPVDLTNFRPDPERRDAARRELGIPQDAVVVGSVANLNPSKGHEHLIRAAALVRRSEPRTLFRIMGADSAPHPEYVASVRAEAERASAGDDPAVRIVDPGARVADLMPALDVLALTSVPNSEGVPTVILEAMACGIPVVATDVGAVREAVEEGATGRVVPPLSPRAVADALLPLVRDPALRAAWGDKARRQARERFGVERVADEHARLYELALEHRRRRAR